MKQWDESEATMYILYKEQNFIQNIADLKEAEKWQLKEWCFLNNDHYDYSNRAYHLGQKKKIELIIEWRDI